MRFWCILAHLGDESVALSLCIAQRVKGFLNDMRYINSRFTYLLTYLLTLQFPLS